MWDSEIGSIAHLFKAPLMLHLNAGNRYFDPATWRFAVTKLEEDMGPWSDGERAMASLALALWGYKTARLEDRFDAYTAAVRLSSINLAYCLEAIAMRGGLLKADGRLGMVLWTDAQPI